MPGRKGMKWGQHIFGDDDYDPHGRPAQIKTYDQYEQTPYEKMMNPIEVGPKVTVPTPKDEKTGERKSFNYVQVFDEKTGKPISKPHLRNRNSFEKQNKELISRAKGRTKNPVAVRQANVGGKHYHQNALEMGNKIAGTYSHMSDADRSLMAKYNINMNPRRRYYTSSVGTGGSWGDFNQTGVAQAKAYQQAVRSKNRASRSDIGNALHDAGEALKSRYKDIRGNVKRDMVNLRNKFNKTAIGQLVKEYKKRKARAKNDLQRAARKIIGK